MNKLILALVLVLLVAVPAQSQSAKPSSLKDLASYSGADRNQLLVEGAKREGKVVWYTTLAARQNKQIANAFEKKYPGVKVETYRSNSTALIQRVLTEAKAGRHLVDTIETTLPGLFTFRESELLMPYTSSYLGEFPDDSKEEAAKSLVYWTIDRESFVGFAYNKNKLQAADVPKNFADLLKPGLKNKMAMDGGSTGARMIGAMLKAKGRDYVLSLKEQNMRLHMIAASALTQLVASGEVISSPSQFYSATHVAMDRGAPLAWVPMDLVVASGGGAAIYAHAQRPHAALLFLDFLLSPEGQQLYEDLYFGSVKKDYGFKRWYPEKGLTIDQYEKEQNKWRDLLMQITQR
ncbi:MAG TPA: extracellular solute-binding protein [Terriglobales bacterium]|nr:extracellular solute-binding protein [Terriglobales bacterium]